LTALESYGNFLTNSIQENTILWVVASGIIAGVIAQILKFLFENKIPEWQKKKANRIAILKYGPAILNTASTLAYTIQNVLNNPSQMKEENRKLDLLYKFGCLFGWIQILRNETFIEQIFILEKSKYSHKMAKELYQISDFLSSISLDYTFDISHPNLVQSVVFPQNEITVIGDLMINKVDNKTKDYHTVLTFSEFLKNYFELETFEKQFESVNAILNNLHRSRLNPQWNMLFIIYLRVFILYSKRNIKPKLLTFEWISRDLRKTISKILWLPNVIIFFFKLLQILISTYRFEPYYAKRMARQWFETITKSIEEEGWKALGSEKFGNSLLRLPRIEKVLLESDFDSLKYYTLIVKPRRYSKLPVTGKKESAQILLFDILLPYFNKKFIDEEVYSDIKYSIENFGYVRIINDYLREHIRSIEERIAEDSNNKIKSKAWNIIGMVNSYLIPEQMYKLKENANIKSIRYFESSIQEDPLNPSPLVNLGLHYLENWKEYDDWTNKSIEFFCKAKELIERNGDMYDIEVSDLWNYLGIAYYVKKEYDHSIKCFNESIRTEKLNGDNTRISGANIEIVKERYSIT
jgi:hypothetical protein